MSGGRDRYLAGRTTSAARPGRDRERARAARSDCGGQRTGVSRSGTGGLERTTRSALEFIQPGTPAQNAYIESFNGRLRDECLNANWFTNLSDARRKIEILRQDYNEQAHTVR
jgi:hypothetical protein